VISPSEIAAARAVPIARLVGEVVTLGRDGFGLCPFHLDHRPTNFHIYPAANIFKCFACDASGDPIAWVQRIRRVDFPTAVRQLVGSWQPQGTRPQLPLLPTRKASRETEVPSLVSELWRGAIAPNLAKWYLESRGIVLKALPEALRGHKRVWNTEASEYRSAMLAAITDAAGRITAVQRIYIEPRLVYDGATEFSKGARAADLKKPKLTFGPMGSGAAKLAAAGEILGLSEGVESALAAAALYRLPVWATCGASRLGSVALPAQVRHVVIFADNDPNDAGRAAAAKAEQAYRRRGYGCQVEFPERKDWCEMLRHG
jgi:putative DNA primase/helicase